MLVKAAAGDIARPLEIVQQLLLGHMQQIDKGVFTEIGTVDEKLQAPPTRFDRLESRVMQDHVNLLADPGVDLRQHLIDPLLVDRLLSIGGLEHLGYECRHAALGNGIALLIGLDARLGENLGQQATLMKGILLFGRSGMRCSHAHIL